MNYTFLGVIVGILVAFAIVFNLWPLLFLALIFGGIGGAVGAHFDHRIDLVEIWANIIGRSRG
ncbi:MAG: hypothetical protein SOW59_02185 [Corynebacterium sp.]|nr:hypothetical protein [Corynebacterium sp.]